MHKRQEKLKELVEQASIHKWTKYDPSACHHTLTPSKETDPSLWKISAAQIPCDWSCFVPCLKVPGTISCLA